MKTLLLTLALLTAAPLSHAGDGRMRATHVGPEYMSLLDVDTRHTRDGSRYSAWTSVYLAQSANDLAQNANVDYMAVWAEYDCRREGRWRALTTQMYALNQPASPIASDVGNLNPWVTAAPGSSPFYAWGGVCENRFDATDVEHPVTRKRTEILRRYRASLRDRR